MPYLLFNAQQAIAFVLKGFSGRRTGFSGPHSTLKDPLKWIGHFPRILPRSSYFFILLIFPLWTDNLLIVSDIKENGVTCFRIPYERMMRQQRLFVLVALMMVLASCQVQYQQYGFSTPDGNARTILTVGMENNLPSRVRSDCKYKM